MRSFGVDIGKQRWERCDGRRTFIIVGVKEEHGHAVRPVLGVNPDSIEQIEKDMVGYNNLIRPYYQPRLFIEEVDGKSVLVIKVTAGERRPL